MIPLEIGADKNIAHSLVICQVAHIILTLLCSFMEVHDTFLLLLVSKARAPSSPAFFFDTKYRAFYLYENKFDAYKAE